MLLSDGVYKRIPQFWLVIGFVFLFLGLSVGSDYRYFPAYIGFGFLCVARGIWIYQARWKVSHKNRLSIARSPRVVQHDNSTESTGTRR